MSRVAPDGTSFDLTGPPDAPVVALIHGLGLARGVWNGLLAGLQTKYRVLNYDLYGHGHSAPSAQTTSLTVYSDQLAGLMDHLAIQRGSVIGFSIGDMINRRFAMDHGARVQSLVILNSPHARGANAQQAVEARALAAQGAFATFDAALERWFTPAALAVGGSAPARVREWRVQCDAQSYEQAAWVLAHGVRELTTPARPINAPTLVMTCENDSGSTPAMSNAITVEIPGARTNIVPHLRHLGMMEDPSAFGGPILQFLEGLD
jgi:(E)-2-((N-methylformamido)methylene)succinate hydrolase